MRVKPVDCTVSNIYDRDVEHGVIESNQKIATVTLKVKKQHATTTLSTYLS